MVFHSNTELGALLRRITMASPVPAKSQPLHNFSLPCLKWKKNHTNNHHRGRRLADSSPQRSPPPDSTLLQSPPFDTAPRRSPMRDCGSESESGHAASLKNGFVSENRKNSAPEGVKTGFSVSSSDLMIEKSEKKSTASEVNVAGGKEERSKIYIRLRKNKPDDVQDEGKTDTVEGEVEESVPKTWNLRPRKPLSKPSNVNGGSPKVGGLSLQENKAQLPPSTQNRPESEANTAEKEKKQKFSIALSREEIEKDIFKMTKSKPARRPRKRAKAVQKQLDNLFPGLWLASITPDLYKVSEAPAKG